MEIAYASGYSPDALPILLKRFKEKTNSYGGANYPAEREKDAKKILLTFNSLEQNKKFVSIRETRYKRYGF